MAKKEAEPIEESPEEEAGETPELESLEAAAESDEAAAEGEEEEVASGVQTTHTIEALLKMTDEQLCGVLGYSRKLAQVKESIQKISTLKGKAREIAEEKIERILTPNIYESDFSYAYEDAVRQANPKKAAAEAYADDSPGSVI